MAERARIVDVRGCDLQLVGKIRGEPDDLGEQTLDVPGKRLDLLRLLEQVGKLEELGDEVRLLEHPLLEAHAA